MMTAQARILYTMAHDGLLPKIFGRTHPKFRTPFYTSMIIAAVAVVLSGFFPVGILGKLTSMGALFVFGMVCLGVLVLRFTQPTLHRPFKTPWTPWLPLFGALACLLPNDLDAGCDMAPAAVLYGAWMCSLLWL